MTPVYRKRPTCALNAVHVGAEYSPDEAEFLQAMERYQRKHKRPFPTFTEVLQVAEALGWRRVTQTRPARRYADS